MEGGSDEEGESEGEEGKRGRYVLDFLLLLVCLKWKLCGEFEGGVGRGCFNFCAKEDNEEEFDEEGERERCGKGFKERSEDDVEGEVGCEEIGKEEQKEVPALKEEVDVEGKDCPMG